MGRTVRIFHISDLHGRGEDGPQGARVRREDPLRWRVIGDEWDKNLEVLREAGPIDLVVFTGDLGDWGHETDYEMGLELLRRTCRALEVPLERLFVVPGNHDIDRKTEEAAWRSMRDRFARAGLDASSWMAGGRSPAGFEDGWRDAVLQRQASFWKAMIELGRLDLAPWWHPHKRLGYRIELKLDRLDAPLWIIGLDTAWLAGDDADTGALLLTEHQVALLANQGRQKLPGFRLALMHHGFADLGDGKRARRLLADRVDLVLHGHQHEAAVEPWASPDHDLLVLAAGCLYEGDAGHRYPNACQVIALELNDEGRPERAVVRFRGWAERNGLFWGDDGLLYRSARNGRLALRREPNGWRVDNGGPQAALWMPASSTAFVGRHNELAAIERALATPGARVAVVAVQGMAGVGKSFLVEEFCAQHAAQFGPMCRWVLDPAKPASADAGLLEIAAQAGIDRDRTPPSEIPALLARQRALVHVDNVDGAEAAAVVVELLDRLPVLPAIVTGRYTTLGTTPGAGWTRVEVECLDADASVAMLRAELGAGSPDEIELRELATTVGGLPLALHLAAGYLRNGFTVAGFLEQLHTSNLGLAPVDRADPVWRSRSRGIVSVSVQISKALFLVEATRRGERWAPALAALGWAPLSGFGRDLGAAMAGLSLGSFETFIHAAASLSLVRRVPASARPDGAWSVHPLVAELVRAEADRADLDERVAAWVSAKADDGVDGRAARWEALSREGAAIHLWLASVDDSTLVRVVPGCWRYATSHGPVRPWLDAARRACRSSHVVRTSGACAWAWAQLAAQVGAHEEVQQAADLLQREGDGERHVALAAGLRADILQARGEFDEALRIHRDDELPVYERLGDVQSKAATLGQIADILHARGELDEALRIRRDDELPVYERLGDVRSKAIVQGKIADILMVRGELDEALRIHRDDVLSIFERVGDVRAKALTQEKIADIFVARGELDEALRIRRDDVLPVLERVGDVREKAVAQGKIADILQIRGELDEALQIRRNDELPVYERFGDVREKAVAQGKIADILQIRGEFDEALRIRRNDELPVLERLGDVREKTVTQVKIAEILGALGEFDEALRILLADVLPVLERLGGRHLMIGLASLGSLLINRGRPDDLQEARRHVERAAKLAKAMRVPFPEWFERWLSSEAG